MRFFLSVLLLLPVAGMSAQNVDDVKRNHFWVLGYEYDTEGAINHVFLDFQGDSLHIDSLLVPNSLYMAYTNASLCDTAGKLLLFSNGCGVLNGQFQPVPGAGHINEGDFQNYLCTEIGGGRYSDALLMLPERDGHTYDLLYHRMANIPLLTADRLLWTRIVRDSAGQLAALFTDSTILEKPLCVGNLSACRHANGQDWWVISPGYLNNEYNRIRIGGSGYSVQTDTIGLMTDDYDNATGEAVFSPDGTLYARYNIHADLQLFDFDRCTGLFSHPRHVPILDAADTIFAAGAAFAPGGRYLYVSSTHKIYQFDLQAPDLAASRTTVAVYDGFHYPFTPATTQFHQCELGPDNKIYVSCPGGKFSFHVIEHPDSAGLACQVIQHKYLLHYPVIGGLPHFPNFRLGALSDSVCPQSPIADFSWQVADTLQPLQVQFKDLSLNPPLTWHWDFGDGSSSELDHPLHIYPTAGTYTVCLVVANPLGADTLCQSVQVGTSGTAETTDATLTLWPNPAGARLYIQGLAQPGDFRIMDVYGRLVQRGRLMPGRNELDLSRLPEGVFFFGVSGMIRPARFEHFRQE